MDGPPAAELTPAAYVRTLVFAAVLGIPSRSPPSSSRRRSTTSRTWSGNGLPRSSAGASPRGGTSCSCLRSRGCSSSPPCGSRARRASPLEGISVGNVRPVDLASILLAALATLGLGLVLGPEAPLIALGIALGAVAVHLTRVAATEASLLVLAGAFAAIAALGGPLVAAFLLLELVAKSGIVPARMIGHALLPGFVAAGSGALVWTGVGDWPGCTRDRSCIRCCPLRHRAPARPALVRADLDRSGRRGRRRASCGVRGRSAHARTAGSRLVGAGLAVGVIAVGFRAAADRPIDLVLFSGQEALPALAAETSAGVLLLVVLAKGVAYALSLGAGFRGGPVFPAIALGTAALAVAAADILPGLDLTPAVATGIAVATAAALQAPFTGAVLGTLPFGSAAPDVAPFTVLAAAVGVLAVIALPDPARKPEPGDAGR